MTTLQDALKKALEKDANEWDKDQQRIDKEKQMPKHMFKPTNNASRATFHFIRDNPNLTQKEILFELGSRGFKENSVSSLITQFIRSGYVQRVDGRLTALTQEYKPVKIKSMKNKIGKVIHKPSKPKVPDAIQAIIEDAWTPSKILDTLSIVQAKQLYTELKQIFSN